MCSGAGAKHSSHFLESLSCISSPSEKFRLCTESYQISVSSEQSAAPTTLFKIMKETYTNNHTMLRDVLVVQLYLLITVWGNFILLKQIQITWRKIAVVSFWVLLEICRMPQIDGLPVFSWVLVSATFQDFLFFMNQKGRTIFSCRSSTQHHGCLEHSVFFFCASLCPTLV